MNEINHVFKIIYFLAIKPFIVITFSDYLYITNQDYKLKDYNLNTLSKHHDLSERKGLLTGLMENNLLVNQAKAVDDRALHLCHDLPVVLLSHRLMKH